MALLAGDTYPARSERESAPFPCWSLWRSPALDDEAAADARHSRCGTSGRMAEWVCCNDRPWGGDRRGGRVCRGRGRSVRWSASSLDGASFVRRGNVRPPAKAGCGPLDWRYSPRSRLHVCRL